jgi:hypothetical protein
MDERAGFVMALVLGGRSLSRQLEQPPETEHEGATTTRVALHTTNIYRFLSPEKRRGRWK